MVRKMVRWSREVRATVERWVRQGIGVSGERRERKDWSDGVLGRAVRERGVEKLQGVSKGMNERESGSERQRLGRRPEWLDIEWV